VVRPYGADGVRVTIGAPEENNALLEFAKGWISPGEDASRAAARGEPGNWIKGDRDE
jgi:hypothetical protein